MIITRKEFLDRLTIKTNKSPASVRKSFDCIVESIAQSLKNGERVEIRRFGSWERRVYPLMKHRNPKTGEPVMREKTKIFFRPSKH